MKEAEALGGVTCGVHTHTKHKPTYIYIHTHIHDESFSLGRCIDEVPNDFKLYEQWREREMGGYILTGYPV